MSETAQPAKMDKYDIENAARTLVEAELITRNKVLYAAAIKYLTDKEAAEEAVIGRK